MSTNIENKMENPIDAEKQGHTRVLIEAAIVMSDALNLDLAEIRDGITEEIDRRIKQKEEEEKRTEWYKTLPYGLPMGF